VLVDGHDLRTVRIQSLRHQVAVVLQDTFLFNASVRGNLLYGKPDATDAELIAAAQAVYAHAFIEAMPNGYDRDRRARRQAERRAAPTPGARAPSWPIRAS
jgi:ABC-type multidrug transport system fused ATPase/permease subunit